MTRERHVADWENACQGEWGPQQDWTCRVRGGSCQTGVGSMSTKVTLHSSGLGFRCCGDSVSTDENPSTNP
jgi:hypothetical protein